jgi:hypothetical protein
VSRDSALTFEILEEPMPEGSVQLAQSGAGYGG